jgi:bacteriocin biosynthesis cyclodehydratase domain-containing protein
MHDYLYVLPGINCILVSNSRLEIDLGYGDVVISGGGVVSASIAVLNYLKAGGVARSALIDTVSTIEKIQSSIVEHAICVLVANRCIFEVEMGAKLSDVQWLSMLKFGSISHSSRLEQYRVQCISREIDSEMLSDSVRCAGMSAFSCVAIDGESAQEFSERVLTNSIGFDASFVYDLNYRHPYTRFVAKTLMKTSMPTLYLENCLTLSRIGPTVTQNYYPCIDCINLRHAANCARLPAFAIDDLRGLELAMLPARTLCHPSLRRVGIEFAVLELSRLASMEAPATFGGYLEASTEGTVVRREVLRAPQCPSCGNSVVEHYPFDTISLN